MREPRVDIRTVFHDDDRQERALARAIISKDDLDYDANLLLPDSNDDSSTSESIDVYPVVNGIFRSASSGGYASSNNTSMRHELTPRPASYAGINSLSSWRAPYNGLRTRDDFTMIPADTFVEGTKASQEVDLIFEDIANHVDCNANTSENISSPVSGSTVDTPGRTDCVKEDAGVNDTTLDGSFNVSDMVNSQVNLRSEI